MIASVTEVAGSPAVELAKRPELEPLGDKVVVLPEKPADRVGRVLLPDSAKKRPTKGVVMARGPKCEYVQVGDVVLFGMYSGTDIELPGGDVKILYEKDLYAKIVT